MEWPKYSDAKIEINDTEDKDNLTQMNIYQNVYLNKDKIISHFQKRKQQYKVEHLSFDFSYWVLNQKILKMTRNIADSKADYLEGVEQSFD